MGGRKRGSTPESHDWEARATEALEEARKMPPGAARNEAMKKAGQLRSAAEMKNYLSSSELKPPK